MANRRSFPNTGQQDNINIWNEKPVPAKRAEISYFFLHPNRKDVKSKWFHVLIAVIDDGKLQPKRLFSLFRDC